MQVDIKLHSTCRDCCTLQHFQLGICHPNGVNYFTSSSAQWARRKQDLSRVRPFNSLDSLSLVYLFTSLLLFSLDVSFHSVFVQLTCAVVWEKHQQKGRRNVCELLIDVTRKRGHYKRQKYHQYVHTTRLHVHSITGDYFYILLLLASRCCLRERCKSMERGGGGGGGKKVNLHEERPFIW